MYNSDFVVCIKSKDGKILRETNNIVYLPFEDEYSIYMKNMREVRVLVAVSIDGEDVLNHNKLIIQPNSILDLERFLEENNERGPRFKFIQKNEKIIDFRGDRIEDGIIRVEFWFEKEIEKEMRIKYSKTNQGKIFNYDEIKESDHRFSLTVNESQGKYDDRGITIKGSESNQKFIEGYICEVEENSHVITLMLKGENPFGEDINNPLTVKTKKFCEICGTQNKSSNKYCHECGNSLIKY